MTHDGLGALLSRPGLARTLPTPPGADMTTTWRPRDSRGHYLASEDVHTTLGPEDWDDTCRHQSATPEPQRCEQCGRTGMRGFTNLAAVEHGISITVCSNKSACRKRWPKPPHDDA